MKMIQRRQGCLSSCKDLAGTRDPYRMTGEFDEVYHAIFRAERILAAGRNLNHATLG
jgi:hypothetical protein